MTDRGIKVRWTTAALVAPAAAALFTGSTVWASGHQPATASTPTAATVTPSPTATVDPIVLALRKAVDANTAQVAKLRTTVATLQAKAAAIAKGGAVTVSRSSGGSTKSTGWKSTSSSSSSRSTSSKSTSSATKKKATSSAPAPAPAPAPASNGSTGASGAK